MSLADVRTAAEVEALATRILGSRDRPLVLVSTDADGLFAFDLTRLRSELDGIADIVTIDTGTASRDLEHFMPPKTHAFGGAARSYPPDFGAAPEWTRSHLRFPGHADTADLIDDALGQTGRRTVESAPARTPRRARGVVQGFVADGSVADSDPDATLIPPLALVVDGSPWLSEERRTRDEDADADPSTPARASGMPEPAGAAPAGVTPTGDLATRHDVNALASEVAAVRRDLLALTNLVARGGRPASDSTELEQLRAENEQLRTSLATERAERAKAETRLAETSQERREAGRALRDARRAAERAHVDPTDEGIRIEIERTWGNRTAPGERDRWPLREFTFGPAFIASLESLDENQLAKAVRACVDAVTGRDKEIPARELHRLRSGEGGDDAYVVRADGSKCWRSAIEQNTPGARRLHYWELPGGGIELSRIVLHDDIRP